MVHVKQHMRKEKKIFISAMIKVIVYMKTEETIKGINI